jgi:hypothetical protein
MQLIKIEASSQKLRIYDSLKRRRTNWNDRRRYSF